jgi:hypothetical protein
MSRESHLSAAFYSGESSLPLHFVAERWDFLLKLALESQILPLKNAARSQILLLHDAAGSQTSNSNNSTKLKQKKMEKTVGKKSGATVTSKALNFQKACYV